MKEKLISLAASLATLFVVAGLALAQVNPGGVQGQDPRDEELLCLIPEGCDINHDGVPDLKAGEPAPGQGANTGFEQYNAT